MRKAEAGIFEPHLPDDVSVRRWFALYALLFAGLAIPLVVLVEREGWTWADWRTDPAGTFGQMGAAVKLLGFALYVSLASTFLPLPTGWIVAYLAIQGVGIASDVWTTTLIVGCVGATGSTVANLNDYHLFTWMLRHHRIAAVRQTRTYHAAARWFARSPFFLLVVFNFIPIPVDVIRLLATSYRYPRVPFAAANFIGRFVRYGAIAFATFWWNLGWIAPVALLGLAVVLGGGRLGPKLLRKLLRWATNRRGAELSNTQKEQSG